MSTILWILSLYHVAYISTRLGDNYLHCQLCLWSTAWSRPPSLSTINPFQLLLPVPRYIKPKKSKH
jgi:hypothetical protein